MDAQVKDSLSDIHEQYLNAQNRGNALIFLVSDNGIILDVNDEGIRLLGYSPGSYAKRHISKLLPKLAKIDLLEDEGERVNSYLRFLSRIGHNFKILASDGNHFKGELYFSDLKHKDQHQILIIFYPN